MLLTTLKPAWLKTPFGTWQSEWLTTTFLAKVKVLAENSTDTAHPLAERLNGCQQIVLDPYQETVITF